MKEENEEGISIEDIKIGEKLEIDIEDVADNGDGVGRLEGGLVVLVEGAFEGKRVKAKVTKKHDSYVKAELIDFIGDIEKEDQDEEDEKDEEEGKYRGGNWYGEN